MTLLNLLREISNYATVDTEILKAIFTKDIIVPSTIVNDWNNGVYNNNINLIIKICRELFVIK